MVFHLERNNIHDCVLAFTIVIIFFLIASLFFILFKFVKRELTLQKLRDFRKNIWITSELVHRKAESYEIEGHVSLFSK